MKQNYTMPWAQIVELDEKDIITTSISLKNNQNGDDDGGDFLDLFPKI